MDIDDRLNQLETKSGIPLDAMVTHAEMMRAFEAFKETNDERLALSEKRAGDVVLDEKLARINATIDAQARRLDEITLKSARPALGGDRAAAQRLGARAQAGFRRLCPLRRKRAACARSNMKALSVGSNPDGGYLVPPEVETQIGARLTAISPIRVDRRPAHHQRQCLQEAVHDGRPRGRLGRRDRRADADGVADARRTVVPGDGALRHAGGDRDAAGRLGGQHRRMARPGSRAGVRGAGGHGLRFRRRRQQAEGLSQLHHGGQCVVELGQYRLYRFGRGRRLSGVEPVRRAGRSDLRGQRRLPAERRVRDEPQDAKRDPQVQGHGRQLSLAAAGGGGRARLADDLPVVEAEDMPDIAANSLSIAFGDFNRGYLIVDRAGVTVLRDPYTAKPYVLFYTTKRVGGGVQDFDAIKLMKFAAS